MPSKKQKTLRFSQGEGSKSLGDTENVEYFSRPSLTDVTPKAQQIQHTSPQGPHRSSASRSANQSPRKTATIRDKTTKGKDSKKASGTRGIHSFFNSITQAQKTRSPSKKNPNVEHQEENDLIEDDPSVQAQNVNPRKLDPYNGPLGFTSQLSSKTQLNDAPYHPIDSKRFAYSDTYEVRNDRGKPLNDDRESDLSGWAEAYPPQSIGELAVHPKKIDAVVEWLQEIGTGNSHKSLLVLKGPAGCGKSAAIRIIARACGLDILEWNNPVGRNSESQEFIPFAAQFEDFLTRNTRYGTLNASNYCQTNSSQTFVSTGNVSQTGSFVLIEDFPNTLRSSSALAIFRLSVLRYMASAAARQDGKREKSAIAVHPVIPMVMLVTETTTTNSIESADSFTVGKLLGPDILQHPATTIVEFNAPSPTLITKALSRIVKKRRRQWAPKTQLIKELSQLGDTRSAINSLEFAYTNSKVQRQGSDTQPRDIHSSYSHNGQESDRNMALKVAHRGNILDIFHAVAKVMYNKRIDTREVVPLEQFAQPPGYLACHARPQVSEVSSEQLMETIGTDAETFIAALHENYIYSCSGRDFTCSFNDCMENLSTADVLNSAPHVTTGSARFMFRQASGHGTVDILKNTELAFHTAVKGLLFALPHPVKRGTNSGTSTNLRDPYKMVYPTSCKIWRQVTDAEALIRYWNRAIESGLGPGEVLLRYRLQRTGQSLLQDDFRASPGILASTTQFPLSPCNRLGMTEMILDYLPYLNAIVTHLSPNSATRDLQGLVNFASSRLSTPESVYEITKQATSASYSPLMEASSASGYRANLVQIARSSTASQQTNEALHIESGLVLSDDDIEDI